MESKWWVLGEKPLVGMEEDEDHRSKLGASKTSNGFIASCLLKLLLQNGRRIHATETLPMDNVISGSVGNCVLCKLEKASCDIDPNACLICKVGGKLLCCEGKECRRSFHLSCLDPPLDNVPLGVWHCPMCIRRKIKFGVHAVSKGVESVLDTREIEISNADGLKRQKQYFVKFKDLAHAHNRWLMETELLLEASSLVSRFNRRNQYSRWKQVWTVPQRLLQKRLLLSANLCEEHDWKVSGAKLNCQYEWLVKWRSLDYKCATWELENASFLSSQDGQDLMKDYESRCEKAKIASHASEVDEMLERKRTAVVNLSQFTDRDTCDFNNNYINYVNKLRKFWHEGKNAVVIDNQDRAAKVIAFILTLAPDVLRPFLIISTSTALGFWDDELLRFAPSFSVVVYKGNKNVRENIRDLEFYQGNCQLFQALICSPEVMMEDLDVLDCINWEVIVVDECQRPSISSYFEKMKMLKTAMWLLVLSDQLKDMKDGYHNLFSLLEENGQVQSEDTLKTNDDDNIRKLKERLVYHTAYTCTAKFVEYWVPARLSNVQLELYCAFLLSNSALLCSSLKGELLDNIHDMLVSTKKCCNHPYIVEPSMGHVITKGHPEVEYLDIGIKASGKLELLDAMLKEMKKKGSRVLILFRSISGSGRDTIGDILDDFLRQRFGIDSYERFDVGLIYSKRQAALNKFNNLESGKFLFLLEIRACLPSIKLPSVDSIVIYDSDWAPMNDLRALQKITLDSQLEQIKIFRLYSSCTIEEQVLMLSLQKKTLDGNLQNISWSYANTLLMWGVSDLFTELEKFLDKAKTADSLSDTTLLEEVVNDFILLISQNGRSADEYDSRVILKVQQIEGAYSAHSPLLGQSKRPSTEEMQPLIFWNKLLDGKRPIWKYSSDRSLRNRKRVQQSDDSSHKSDFEIEETVRKRKKVSNSNLKVTQDENFTNKEKKDTSGAPKDTCQNSSSLAACEDDLYIENHLSPSSLIANDISKILDYKSVGFDAIRKLIDLRKSLHHLLKPEISQLCQILKLPEYVQRGVEIFFKYVMDNHHIITEPATTTLLQAFQLSLCWTIVSMLDYKIDRKESLALAKKHLNFDCHRQEVYLLYSRLRCLKKIFSKHLECYKVPESSFASESPHNVLPDNEFHKVVVKNINRIQKTCRKEFEKLKQKQKGEKDEFDRIRDEDKSQIEIQFRMESAVICSCLNSSLFMRNNKLHVLKNKYAKELEEHQCQMEIRRKKLEEEHIDERNKMIEMEAHWVDALTSWFQVEVLNKQILNQTEQSQNNLPVNELFHGLGTETPVRDHLPEENRSKVLHNVTGTGEISEIPGSVSSKAIICNNVAKVSLQTRQNDETAALDTMGSQGPSTTEFEDHDRITSFNGTERNLTVPLLLSRERGGNEATGNPRSEVLRGTCSIDPDVHSHDLSDTLSLPELAFTPTVEGDGSLLFIQAARNEMNQQSLSTELMDDIMQATAMVNTNGDTEAPISYVSDQSIQKAQTIEPQTPMVPLATNVGFFQADLSSDGGMENQIDREEYSCGQLAQEESQPIEIPIRSVDEVLLQHVTCTAPHSTPNDAFSDTRISFLDTRTLSANFDISNGMMPTQPSVSQMPSLLYIDPLEKELEKLSKEIDQNIDIHTKRKLQLKSECEKEIEEVTAQIQKKYETMLQESETEFDLRKRDLDVNYNKVLLNKILAGAFRWKCNDTKECDIGPSLAPQILQPPHLQNLPAPPLVVRPCLTPALVSSQTFNAPSINIQRTATVANLSTNLPASSQSTATTSMHDHHASTHFSGHPMRPPRISSISSPTGNPQVRSVIRAPAPHLQPFRPTSSISAANPRCISTQHGPSNPSTTPPSFPQLPPRPLISTPHQSISLDTSYHPDSSEQLPTFSNSSLSAIDMNNRAGVNFPHNFPPQAEVTLNTQQLVPPVSTGSSTQVNVVNSTGDSDVCLSDGD